MLYWTQKGRLNLMWTKIILSVLAAMEIGFLGWDLVSKTTHYRLKTAFRLGAAAILTLLMLLGVLQGASRYAGIIALLAVMGMVSLLSLRKKGERKISKPARRVWRSVGSMALYLTAMTVAILFPQVEEIPVTGDHAIQTVLYTWKDERREETFAGNGEKRCVTVQFYYPETAGCYPLALYSHGAASTMDANDSTCRELASHGYVVAAVAHPYHAMFVTDASGVTTSVDPDFMQLSMSGPLTHTNEEMLAYYREWMKTRTDDLHFALDTILTHAARNDADVFARIDPEHIGLFGHSMGGAACEALGRQRDDIDAVIVLEGMMLGELTGADETGFTYGNTPYPLPLLDINSDSIASRGMEQMFGSREYVNFNVVKNGTDAREVTFRNAAHMNFCDLPTVSPVMASLFGVGSRDSRDCIVTVNGIVTEYFDHYLKGESPLDIAEEY